jgi:hypothetical protein
VCRVRAVAGEKTARDRIHEGFVEVNERDTVLPCIAANPSVLLANRRWPRCCIVVRGMVAMIGCFPTARILAMVDLMLAI